MRSIYYCSLSSHYGKCSIVGTYVPFIDFKVVVSLDHGVPLCFIALLALKHFGLNSNQK